MADSKSIRITTDYSDALRQQQQYSQSAKKVFDNINRSVSQQYTKEADVNKVLKERITLLERQQKLDTERDIALQKELYKKKLISKSDYESGVSSIRGESLDSKKFTGELRKVFSEHVENQRKVSSGNLRGFNQTQNVAGQLASGNVLGAGSSMMGGIGKAAMSNPVTAAIAIIAGLAIGKMYTGGKRFEEAVGDQAVYSGVSYRSQGIRDYAGKMDNHRLAKLGLKPSDMARLDFEYGTASGGALNESAVNLYGLEKSTLMNRGDISQSLEAMRYSKGGTASGAYNYLFNSGRSNGKNYKQSGVEATEMMRAVSSMMQSQGAEGITSDMGSVGGLASFLQGSGFKGASLTTAMNKMQSASALSNNPVSKAIQFQALSKAMPGASLLEMQMAMEEGFSTKRGSKYMQERLGMLKEQTGGGDDYIRAISKEMGVNLHSAKAISEGDFNSVKKMGKGAVDFESRGMAMTSSSDIVKATWEGTGETTGFKAMDWGGQQVENWGEAVKDNSETLRDHATLMKDLNSKMDVNTASLNEMNKTIKTYTYGRVK